MALEGNAKDFGLSEIFQLISIQKKSGMLSVSADQSAAIFFQDGMIISTRDRRNSSNDPLKDFLVRYGFIGRREMGSIQKILSESSFDLTDILLSEKYFNEDELGTIFSEQIYESIQEVLSWPKSQYKFIIGSNVLTGVKSYASLKVEAVLMESYRRIDELPEMRRIFTSDDMTFRRLAMPQGKKISLEHNEEIIYGLLEEERSLASIVSHAKQARFCTYESLKQLLEKGVLEFSEAAPAVTEEPIFKEEKKKKEAPGRLLPTFAAIFMLLASYAIGEYAVPRLSPPGWTARRAFATEAGQATGAGVLSTDLEELRLRSLESAIRQGLEEHFASQGSYPFTLEVLAVRRILSEKAVGLAQHGGINYRMGEDGMSYVLSRN